jgi:NAD(P)-dependent dehydrogenase (short-subunit alcohol dehydrogenase family)
MSQFGRATTAQEAARNADLRGRLVVLTGASSGLGAETARALALAGADLVLGVRNLHAGEAVARSLVAATGRIRVLALDLCDLAAVLSFAAQITGPVDVLIANAGVSKTPDAHLSNGLDVRFATNHLGHFLLAWRLRRQMAQRGARIVVLSSAAHKSSPIHLDDLQWKLRPHLDGAAYAESKSANILFAQEATRRWGAQRIFANAVLPGSALTGLQRYHGEALKRRIGFINADGSVNPMVKTIAQAAATTVWAATALELQGRGGLVLEDCAEAIRVGPDTHAWSGFDPSVADPDTARRLWDHSIALIRGLCDDAAISDEAT